MVPELESARMVAKKVGGSGYMPEKEWGRGPYVCKCMTKPAAPN